MTTLAPLHVIVGAGQIGPQIARRLVARGLRVRVIRRSPSTDPAIETVTADVRDPAAAAEAMRGASVVYHTANPRYHRWGQELLPQNRGIVAGAAKVGARVVVLDNLYMYGTPPGGVMREDSPMNPRSVKGGLRAQAATELLDAHARGDAQIVIARAADFFGPGILNSLLGERFWKKLVAGKPIEVLGDVDQPHSYSYGQDVADGLVTLGLSENRTDYGRVWHLPTLPAESTRVWAARFATAFGTTPRFRRLTPWMLRMFGLFIPEAKELPEMAYQWEGPFLLDDSAFRARFAAAPTPLADAVAATIAWARATYAPERDEAPLARGPVGPSTAAR
ncbi:MAG: NAD-dependent epimerase/dehydratase family protein [Deltaproteobacteria bacterium]|nr:NAD-dependent epimerase/dehydratase family protein [Deltaproteobacteria bacterium]